MANGTAKQQVIDKFHSDNAETAGNTWDLLNLDSVPFGMDHMVLSWALETSVDEALVNVAKVHEGYPTLRDYLDSNYMSCARDYRDIASANLANDSELASKINKIFNEACILNQPLGFTST